ncbi:MULTISPECIES: AMP-binding protein [unclassified Lactobacillus]|uniref:AMP-binding protein n=1 Tax=unclassified Lactobacillus TaxID=2620435 RepID=UPI000EFD8D76|nr:MULTISPECIES: AMP-binding protein [unclassified Lactobacillus]RMC25998.1 hypothetical protein F5ESL0247_00355 [Lactobacillus sp. ESL0247]RMC29691.1 hypothetical protein F5ESL0246_00355 [Lactobacillus sp. ESL0246]RMC34096.1 hypothetical protein F5ESL0245_00355 [Lactobacillus sp. ESL0245]
MDTNAKVTTVKQLWNERLKQSRNDIFIIDGEHKYNYTEIGRMVDDQVELLKSYGIKKRDLVALQFELDVENIVMMLACIKLGVIINPLNPHFDLDELDNLMKKFKPFAIISQKSVRGRDNISKFSKLDHYYSQNIGDLKIFVRKKRELSPFIDDYGSDAALIVLNTSGTSSMPKGVVLTNKNVLSSEYAYNETFKITSKDTVLILSGMYHAIGFHHGLISTMIAGSTIVIIKHYNIDEVSKLLKKESITFIDSLPTVMFDILYKVKDLGRLRQLICGGDRINRKLLLKAKERGIPLYNCYGLTEAVPFSYTPRDYYFKCDCMTTAVLPMSGVELRIVQKHHQIKEKDKQGLIEVAGPIVFKEYLGDPVKTKSAFDGKWLITGDVGHYNQTGLLEIDGRSSDKIIRGGENISTSTVEEKLKKCSCIKEAAVLGIPDLRLGQKIGAAVVLTDNRQEVTKNKIISELKHCNVDKKYWPEEVCIVDSLPKTTNGKIKKYILLNQLEGQK